MLVYYIVLVLVYVCCIGALIVPILNSRHHEVVGNMFNKSGNHRIPYNTHIYYHHITTSQYTSLIYNNSNDNGNSNGEK